MGDLFCSSLRVERMHGCEYTRGKDVMSAPASGAGSL